jgi:hypothetical protein
LLPPFQILFLLFRVKYLLYLFLKVFQFFALRDLGVPPPHDGQRVWSTTTTHGANPYGFERVEPFGFERVEPSGFERVEPFGFERVEPSGFERVEPFFLPRRPTASLIRRHRFRLLIHTKVLMLLLLLNWLLKMGRHRR